MKYHQLSYMLLIILVFLVTYSYLAEAKPIKYPTRAVKTLQKEREARKALDKQSTEEEKAVTAVEPENPPQKTEKEKDKTASITKDEQEVPKKKEIIVERKFKNHVGRSNYKRVDRTYDEPKKK